MKKRLKQLICLALAICIAFGGIALSVGQLKANAEAYSGSCGDNAEWSLESGVLTINGSGSTGTYQAVSGNKAPWYNHKDEILHVIINEGITSIGIGSFQDCLNLLDVNLPETLKVISGMSFSGCNKLQNISITANVENIDASAFFECTVLETVSVDSDNTSYSDDNGVLFNKSRTKLVFFPKGKIITEYSIPEGVTEIGEYAFANCSELIGIEIPDSVKTIGINAFQNCRTLLSVDIPEGVTAIKSNTFYGCSALYEVSLPSTVTVIGSNAFGKCGSLMKINIPNATKSIDASAFSTSPNLTVYCDKDSTANEFCILNSVDYCYSNLSSVYPVANWVFANVPHSGQRYVRIDVKCTWDEAKIVCEMLGGHLATVTSAEEMATIKTLISSGTPYAYWLGASDEKTEGTWEWVTGEPFNYSLWSSGQPDDCGGVEDYLETWGRGESWNDNNLYGSSTEDSRGFVCEFENYYIPSKTIVYNDNIYCLYDELVSWYTAYNVCQNIGGHLATVTSAEEQKVVTDLCYGSFYTAYWLGATDDSSEGDWKWVTGEPFSYTNWSSGEPNNANSNEHYLEQYYTWNDYIDEGYRGFICEIESFSNLPISSGYFKGNRYEVYNNNLSWFNAQQIAQSKGGHLATTIDSDEAAYIHTLYKDLTLADDYLNIGGFRYKHEDGYRWVTGEKFSYSNWNDGEPNNNQLVENYTQVYRYSNGWNDIGNKGSGYDGSVFIVEYESPKQVVTLSETDGTVLNRYKVQGGLAVDKPLKDYKPGYTAEWYKEPTLQNKWNFETDTVTEDTVLYANWIPDTITVSFETNGGDCGDDSKKVVFDSQYGALPDCSREGYAFMGWYTDEACTIKADTDTAVSITDDHTLYAKWQAETYTVTFESNGGESAEGSKTVSFGEPYGDLPECTLSGADFMGWYSDEECTEIITEDTIVETPENHILYAGWYESSVTKLQLVSKPMKTDYYVGETLDTSGISVLATFENGSQGEIPSERLDFSITEFDRAGKKIVKASYGGKYVSFIVNVSSRVLKSVSVAAFPEKISYTVGEILDTTGLELTATYDNSSTKTITEGFTAACDLSSAGTKTVTVEYTENGATVTTSYEIIVAEKVEEPDAVVSASSVSASAGETISVPFYIENNKGFVGFAITVDYDSEAFTPVSITSGDMLSAGTLNDSIGTAYEYLKIVYVGSENVVGDGELFTVGFIVNENASGDYDFDVSYLQPDTFNEADEDVVLECNDFDVSVLNSTVEQSVKINGGLINAVAGSSVTLPLYIENASGINSFELKMTYNGEVLTFSEVKNGEVLTDGNVNATVSDTNELSLVWSGSSVSEDGALLYVTFDIENYIQSVETVSVLCNTASFADGSTKNIICCEARINITNPYANENAVIYSDEWLRIVDSTIEIPLYIRNNQGMMGFGLNIEYDSSVVTPVSVTAAEMLTSGYLAENIGTNDSNFKIIWNHTENISENGLLMTLKFTVSEGVTPEKVPMTVTYSQPDTYNESWEDVILEPDNTGFKISYIYTATFTHNGEIIGTDEFSPDDESLDYPVIEPKPYYEWVWEEHEISAGDMVISGQYVPVEYSIYYYCDEIIVSTDKYTVETTMEQIVLPEIPEKMGYIGKWESFTLSTEDININCIYSPIIYTATFTFEGEVIGTDEFTVEDAALDFPEVAPKEHYECVWDDYAVVAGNITVSGGYVPVEYTINFVSDGITVKTQNYTVETYDSIEAPELSLPEKIGYYSVWENWEGKIGNFTVNEIYIAIEYKICFYCGETLVSTETYTVETDKEQILLPEVPEKAGYVGEWDEFVLGTEDIDVYCSYELVIYTATFVDNEERVLGTDEFTVEDESFDYPSVTSKAHYNWVWVEQTIEAENLTVKGSYVPVIYTITFVSDGNVVEVQEYTVESANNVVPPALSLPGKQHYTSQWEDWKGKIGNLTVNEIYVPIKYKLSFYCQSKLIETRIFTIESNINQVIVPPQTTLKGYTVEWPEFTLSYEDTEVHAVCTLITYTAQFVADDKIVAIRTFTVETEKLEEPDVPQKPGYIAAWSGYTIKAENMIIKAKYYLPDVVMVSKSTLKVEETMRLLPSCNFDSTKKVWSSSDPSVATVDKHGNITAVGEGECEITVTCYGEDSFGNDIHASAKTEIVVKEKLNAETLKQRFRAAFDEFFQVKLHDIMYNFREFMKVLFRYAY